MSATTDTELRERLQEGLLLVLSKAKVTPNKMGSYHFDLADDALDDLMVAVQAYCEQSSASLNKSERFDYERLKKLEVRGLDEYQEMRKAKVLTPECVVAFINQLSPWNLKTTGISVLNTYAAKYKQSPGAPVERGE